MLQFLEEVGGPFWCPACEQKILYAVKRDGGIVLRCYDRACRAEFDQKTFKLLRRSDLYEDKNESVEDVL